MPVWFRCWPEECSFYWSEGNFSLMRPDKEFLFWTQVDSRTLRTSYPPHAVLSWSILRLVSVGLSLHLNRNKPWCPEMCPRVASIGKCRAPRVNDDSLSARHCITECIYSIYPGTKVCGSSAGHRSWQWPASCSKQAARATPKGSAYCKGPQDRLLIVRYACFVPVVAINKPDFLAGGVIFL